MEVFKAYPLENSPGYLINRLAAKMNAVLHRAFKSAGYNITAQQWAVLNRLWEENGLHQSLIAERTTKNRHNVSRMLTVLEKQGYLERRPDPEDARLQRIYLTKEGTKLQDVLIPTAEIVIENMFNGVKGTDLAKMKKTMERLSKNLDAIDDFTILSGERGEFR
jgi:DNA-binding MarR family transcriptional regulator